MHGNCHLGGTVCVEMDETDGVRGDELKLKFVLESKCCSLPYRLLDFVSGYRFLKSGR